jgi:colanic acid biosynthesis glycosyl transferase WcaI
MLSANYSPELTGIGPFATGLAEYLSAGGHDVRVCTAFPHFPEWRLEPPHARKLLVTEYRSGVCVQRSRPFLPHDRKSLGGRILYDVSLASGALTNALRGPRPDIILAVSPPIQTAIAAELLGRLWNRPTIVWVQDLVVDAGSAAGVLTSKLATRIGRRIEAKAVRTCTFAVSVGDGMRERIRVLSGRDDVLVIPNWANLGGGTLNSAAKSRSSEDRTLVVHAGNLGNKMGTPMLVDAASICSEIDFVIIGEGAEREEVRRRIAEVGATNVDLLGLLPSDDYLRWMGRANVLLLCQKPDVKQSVVPSKLLGYMVAGKPIVAAVSRDSEAAHIVFEAGCGLVVQPEDPGAFAAAIRELAANPEKAERMGARGRTYATRRYGKDRILNQWTELIKRTA